MSGLNGKVAIVTGGARRMGRRIALRLAEAGASVVIATKQSADAAKAVVGEITMSGGSALQVVGDLARPDGAKLMVDAALDKFGRIDILVNNAAIRYRSPLHELSFAEWR